MYRRSKYTWLIEFSTVCIAYITLKTYDYFFRNTEVTNSIRNGFVYELKWDTSASFWSLPVKAVFISMLKNKRRWLVTWCAVSPCRLVWCRPSSGLVHDAAAAWPWTGVQQMKSNGTSNVAWRISGTEQTHLICLLLLLYSVFGVGSAAAPEQDTPNQQTLSTKDSRLRSLPGRSVSLPVKKSGPAIK